MNEVRIKLPPKLVPVLGPPRGSAMYRCMYGGRGAGRSFSSALIASIWGYAEPLRILCTRELQVSIKESFHAELKAAIAAYPFLSNHYDVGVDYLRGKNGTEFIFRGLRHNIEAVKSTAKIDLTVVEEAENVPESAWLDLEATVFRQPKSEMFVIWNPKIENSPVDKRFIKSPPHESLIAKVNWNDNPFFPPSLEKVRIKEQERLDPATYAWNWEGEYLINSDAQVFNGKIRVEWFTPGEDWDGPYYGGDFGFSQDPTAAVEVWIKGDEIFVYREALKTGLELDDTAAFVIRKIPGFAKAVSRWDNSRPESISHLKRHGLPLARSVRKWPGSVEDGIQFLRSYKNIVIHPQCEATITESRMYSYKIDRLTKDVTSTLIDADNHCWDAIRYAVEPIISAKWNGKGLKISFMN